MAAPGQISPDLEWISEPLPRWDRDKARIFGQLPDGVFGRVFSGRRAGELVPGDWWRVEAHGETLAYGWMDVTWGDAEISLVVATEARRRGIGSFVVDNLEREAHARGLNYLYNVVQRSHPEHEAVTAWLKSRRFTASEDGRLLRAIAMPNAHVG